MANTPKTPAAKPMQTRTPAAAPAATGTLPGTAAVPRDIAMEDIIVRKGHNARQDFNPEKLAQLRNSMADIGLQQPIGVTPAYAGKSPGEQPIAGKFFLVYGERRHRAAKDLGWKTITALVGNDDPRRGIAENFDRENLLPWERVQLVVKLRSEGMSNPAIGKELGISPEAVSNDYAIGTKLLPEVFEAWKTHPSATTRLAIQLSGMEPDDQRKAWAEFLAGAPSVKGKRGKKDKKDDNGKPSKKEANDTYADIVRASAVPGKEGVQDWLLGARYAMEYMYGAKGIRMPEEVEAHVKAIKANASATPTLPGTAKAPAKK